MENKRISRVVVLMVVLALVLGMGTSVMAETKDTTASVEFNTNPETNKLELNSAPSLNFGQHELPSGSTKLTATQVSGPLSVTDTRGSLDGWDVTAKLSEFNTDSVNDSMPGAYITLENPSVNRDGTGTSKSPVAEDPINLVAGDADSVPVESAASRAGVGTWLTSWSNSNVSLSILDTPATGNNNATISWTLISAPSN